MTFVISFANLKNYKIIFVCFDPHVFLVVIFDLDILF